MACGTGKTLTGQRIAEQLGSNTTLVLLPSLLLLSKTISDWLTEAKQDFIFLPVCSDSSVTKKIDDQIQTSTSEMGFKTTTDAGEIATFLKRSVNKVFFSTFFKEYQAKALFLFFWRMLAFFLCHFHVNTRP